MTYVTNLDVHFGDVDYARIVYYPRFFHLLHIAFEQLLHEHVGVPYQELIEAQNLGFPTVHIETDFVRPIKFGETMRVEITVPRIGTSSLVFDHVVKVVGSPEIRVTASLTRVAVDMQTLKPVPLPSQLKERLEKLHPDF